MLVWPSQINKSHSIDVKDMKRVVREVGRGGFKYTDSEDAGLVALVRAKIKALYEKYFVKVVPSVTLQPGIRARASIHLEPGVVVFPGVRSE
ncbi:unnamed protein product [marine sediment metagenome]|uniref:Uncharacterized protein n=1 Tax=marine sediment metagenome TaxID=412755 RepID=X1JG21_9ZZZZ